MGRVKADDALAEWARALIRRLGAEHSHKRGWQSLVAKRLQMDRSELSRILRGKRAIEWSVACRIAERAGVELRFYEPTAAAPVASRSAQRLAKQVAILLEAHLIAEKKVALNEEICQLNRELVQAPAKIESERVALRRATRETTHERQVFAAVEREFANKRQWFANLDREIEASRKIRNELRFEVYALREELKRAQPTPADAAEPAS